jgi:hypothetical protein
MSHTFKFQSARAAFGTLCLPLAAGLALELATGPCAADPGPLQACAAIADATARLACYDKLAGAAPAANTAAPAPPAASAANPAAPPSTMPAAPGAPSTTTPPVAPKESFGLYAVEHPALATAQSLQDTVVAVGASQSGRMTVTLGGGGLWEVLDGGDPLLAAGDAITIRRAAFGSYLMETPSKRMHRVHRLH